MCRTFEGDEPIIVNDSNREKNDETLDREADEADKKDTNKKRRQPRLILNRRNPLFNMIVKFDPTYKQMVPISNAIVNIIDEQPYPSYKKNLLEYTLPLRIYGRDW